MQIETQAFIEDICGQSRHGSFYVPFGGDEKEAIEKTHDTDEMDACTYAVDLLPLIDGGCEADFITGYINRFAEDVASRIDALR